ncbi:MAG: hypothetical protein J2P25_18770 [Nocardiopsaceae bacterium]|nr:hypothetical protein [Nocardiopsaceae bacterium]
MVHVEKRPGRSARIRVTYETPGSQGGLLISFETADGTEEFWAQADSVLLTSPLDCVIDGAIARSIAQSRGCGLRRGRP